MGFYWFPIDFPRMTQRCNGDPVAPGRAQPNRCAPAPAPLLRASASWADRTARPCNATQLDPIHESMSDDSDDRTSMLQISSDRNEWRVLENLEKTSWIVRTYWVECVVFFCLQKFNHIHRSYDQCNLWYYQDIKGWVCWLEMIGMQCSSYVHHMFIRICQNKWWWSMM